MNSLIERFIGGIFGAISAIFSKLWDLLTGNLWRLLTVSAIIFAAGISGSWLGAQMRDPLPNWWGWFGAALAGIAVFGGVTLILERNPIGWIIMAVGGIADIALSAAYFGDGHNLILAIVLGAYPTGIAILGGVVEATTAKLQAHKTETEERKKWEREQEEKDRDAERLRKEEAMRLRAQVRIEEIRAQALLSAELRELPPPTAENPRKSAEKSLTTEEFRELSAIRSAVSGPKFSTPEAIAVSSFGKTKVYSLLDAALASGNVRKVAQGQWEFTE